MEKYPFNLLTEYFVKENNIDTSKDYEIVSVSARNLICANRFDLMAKWIYIDAREKNIDMAMARRVYKDNIDSFSCGSFFEPGMDKKNSFQKYLNDFDAIIDDIREKGFDESLSLIPVGKGDRLFDGSHRVSAAAYFDKNVTIIRFPDMMPRYDYDYRYFRKYIMCDINMGYMARQYAYLKSDCYFVCLWPTAEKSKHHEAEKLLRSIGEIVYSQDIYLNYTGICNFMIQIYGKQDWVGNVGNEFKGVEAKAQRCFKQKTATRTYLVQADNLETILNIKEQIRVIYGIGNHSIHISDNIEETREMVELLYNPNSVNFMNYAQPYRFSMVFHQLKILKALICKNGFDQGRFVIDSGSVLEVCGLRAARDLDLLTDYIYKEEQEINEFASATEKGSLGDRLKYYSISIKDMLYNPENYFFYRGMKFVSLNRIVGMKICRNEAKDIIDVELCRKFIDRYKETPKRMRYETIEKINKYQIEHHDYGHGPLDFKDYVLNIICNRGAWIKKTFFFIKKIKASVISIKSAEKQREKWVKKQRKLLKNVNPSIISSNCNGGVISSDLGLEFKSPFVNLFIQASDYIKILQDLKGYMSEELRFVNEIDPIYGEVSYPTAYLRDAKIYFMHYKTEKEAKAAWERRRERINWDNLYIMFTDRSQCGQKNLEDFDKLPYEHKVVFTHIPHPEIKSSFYIRGYENEEKVPILSAFEDDNYPVKRIYDQFDVVGWLNGK